MKSLKETLLGKKGTPSQHDDNNNHSQSQSHSHSHSHSHDHDIPWILKTVILLNLGMRFYMIFINAYSGSEKISSLVFYI